MELDYSLIAEWVLKAGPLAVTSYIGYRVKKMFSDLDKIPVLETTIESQKTSINGLGKKITEMEKKLIETMATNKGEISKDLEKLLASRDMVLKLEAVSEMSLKEIASLNTRVRDLERG